MQILHPSWFASIVSSDNGNLEKISVFIGKYLGNVKKEEFIQACEKLDFNSANEILDKTIICMSGGNQDSVSSALMEYIRKFPQIENEIHDELVHAMSDADKIKIIDCNYSKLKRIIDSR